MYMNGTRDLDSHTSRYFTDFISKSGYDPKSFRGVSVEDLPVVEEIVQRNIFIYKFDIQDGEYVGELARRSIGRSDETVKLLRFNNHIINTNDIDSFFKCFRCPSCDTFFLLNPTILTNIPISVSISSNLIDEPIFLYNKDPQNLIIDFVSKLELLAEKSKLEMRTKFQDIEVAVNERMKKIFDQLSERGKNYSSNIFEYEDECIEDSEEADMSTQFLRFQKNQLIDLKQHLERYINNLPVFGFNNGRYDLNLIKSYWIPYLIRDKEQETSVIKKANDFISFKFGDVQFLDIMKFLGGATTLYSFFKAYKASETKGFFPYEWFDNPDKLDFPGLPPYEAFFSKLRNNDPLDKDFTDYEKLRKSGHDEQQALKKLQIKTVPPSGLDNYSNLQQTWQKNRMTVFKDFLQWYNNKDVVPTLEAMQKMIQFYHNKGIDMLKLGCTLPNLANKCLHKSSNYKFYPFCEKNKDLCEKIREDMTGGPSIVFTRKAVVDETYIRNSSNVCKSIVGIDASQLYPYSMCQDMPTGLYTRWEFDTDMQKFKARHNRTRNFENMVMENRRKLTVLM